MLPISRPLTTYTLSTHLAEEDHADATRHEEPHKPSSLGHRLDPAERGVHGILERGVPHQEILAASGGAIFGYFFDFLFLRHTLYYTIRTFKHNPTHIDSR